MKIGQTVTRDDPAYTGQAAYRPHLLAVYDWLVLRFTFRWAWKCPKQHILSLYNRCVRKRHVDVGVGTGFFLEKCHFSVPQPEILLIDANVNSLTVASKRLQRFNPQTLKADILKPIHFTDQRFGSAAVCSLLHCLPGPIIMKATQVFQHLKPLLSEDAVLFGNTILGKGVEHTRYARFVLFMGNRRGIFNNYSDDLEGLERALETCFKYYKTWMRGSIALFIASDNHQVFTSCIDSGSFNKCSSV
jgi:hypothetical protein